MLIVPQRPTTPVASLINAVPMKVLSAEGSASLSIRIILIDIKAHSDF